MDIAQLINNESFLNYCFRRNSEDVRYWERWLKEHPQRRTEIENLRQTIILLADSSRERVKDTHFAQLQQQIEVARNRSYKLSFSLGRKLIVAAAVVLAVISACAYLYLREKEESQDRLVKHDILPGGNRATLTLGNGRSIDLSTAQTGITVKKGVRYLDGSNVLEDVEESHLSNSSRQLMLTTPKGGQYQVILDDGTKVWLNAASTLTYPSRFGDRVREVQIAGEAYFEVTPDQDRPFKVFSQGQRIDVLGTAFNIQAYADEKVTTTTLIQGKVRVQSVKETTSGEKILLPGEAAVLSEKGMRVQPADTLSATAWKNGLFRYNEEPLNAIMRKLARWYQVEVIYQNESLGEEPFVGMVSRYSNISGVLEVLEEVGNARFTIKGNTIIVDKKQ